MKTSFYFVLWIIIYPILGIFNNEFIYNNSFLVALLIVWGLSLLLNRLMPNILAYERLTQSLPILEDIYRNNVSSFKKRLSRDAIIAFVSSLYFIIATIVIAFAIFEYGINDWIALILFGFFTYGAISQSIALVKAKSELRSNPTTEQCIEITERIYKLDYTAYEEDYDGTSYNDMYSRAPRFFKLFKIISIIFAILAAILGLLLIIVGIGGIFGQLSFSSGTVYVMRFLYGSLAMYFGIKDFISCIKTKTAPTSDNNELYIEDDSN